MNAGGGGCNPKKPNATAYFKFGTGFFFGFFWFFFFFGFSVFSVFPFRPILTGLTGSCEVVLVGYNSFYDTFALSVLLGSSWPPKTSLLT